MVDKKNLKKDPHKKLVEVAKGDTWLNYPTIQCSIDKNETQKIPIIVQLKNWYFQNKMRNNVLVIEGSRCYVRLALLRQFKSD